MSDPLIEDYLRWLSPQIRDEDDGNRSRTYEGLIQIMFEKEFVWHIPHDGNRIGDGLALRLEFRNEARIPPRRAGMFFDQSNPYPPCSFLEVLIGLSRRLSFDASGRAESWAWTLINNLELHRMWDPVSRSKARRIDAILDRCIWRTYDADGRGGFFPLAWPNEDQRRVEIWYQMAAFISELHPGH